MATQQQVLVFPRACIESFSWSFAHWPDVAELVDCVQTQSRWLSRSTAERERRRVQMIACALISDQKRTRYCVIQRKDAARRDLRGRLSLVVGGHVEPSSAEQPPPRQKLPDVLRQTVTREVKEELGIAPATSVGPLAILIDRTSVSSSRHVAFLHEFVTTERSVVPDEVEFAPESRLPGRFLAVPQIVRLRHRFDPWSQLVVTHHFDSSGFNSWEERDWQRSI